MDPVRDMLGSIFTSTCAPSLTGGVHWWLEVEVGAVMRNQGSDFPPAPNLNNQLRDCFLTNLNV